MNQKYQPITQKGINKKEQKLKRLKEKRFQIIEQLRDVKGEQGKLSGNVATLSAIEQKKTEVEKQIVFLERKTRKGTIAHTAQPVLRKTWKYRKPFQRSKKIYRNTQDTRRIHKIEKQSKRKQNTLQKIAQTEQDITTYRKIVQHASRQIRKREQELQQLKQRIRDLS